MSSDPRIDPREFRNALGHFATGVAVLTAQRAGQTYGMTVNAFASVSLDPPLVLVAVNNRATLRQQLARQQLFGVSVLAEGQEDLSNHFARRPVEGLQVRFVEKHGAAVLEGALAEIIARVVEIHPAGDHALYIGQVVHLEWRAGNPLLFYAGKYHRLHADSPPPPAPPEDDFSIFVYGSP